MKISKKVVRFMSGLLTMLLIVQAPITVFASQPPNKSFIQDGLQIEAINNKVISVKTSDSEGIVKVDEINGIRTITITDSTSGRTDYIIYNENSNTVFSSLTGQTIDLNKNQELSPEAFTISTRSSSSYETKYISYAQIKSIVGGTASAAAVVGAILYFVPGAQSIGGAISAVSTIVGVLNSQVSASRNHGIKLRIKVTKYYRTRMGRRQVYSVTRSIKSGGLY